MTTKSSTTKPRLLLLVYNLCEEIPHLIQKMNTVKAEFLLHVFCIT